MRLCLLPMGGTSPLGMGPGPKHIHLNLREVPRRGHPELRSCGCFVTACNRRFTGALHRHMNHDGISAFAGNSGIRVGYPTCRFLLPQGEVSAESLSRDNVSTAWCLE